MEALKLCDGEKTPGPEGFSMAFFKHCWQVVRDNVMAVFNHFHQSSSSEKSLNAIFLALIPKEGWD